tara:strand:- start:5093 stop:6628 length:1536 start_codon:yes stop_codon:yes gene_type:complete
MKSLSQIREASGGKEAYQKFFNSILKKFGVDSPSELEGDAKKKFYDAIDKGWESDDPNDKNETYTDPDNLDPDTTVNADEDDFATGKALGESTAAYAASLNKIANDKKLKSISKADKETLAKIAKLLQSEGNEWDSGEYEPLDEAYPKVMDFKKTSKEIGKLKSTIHQPVIKQISALFLKMFSNSSLKVRDDAVLQINKLKNKVDGDTRVDINKILNTNKMLTKDGKIVVEGTESLDEAFAKSYGYTHTEAAINHLMKALNPKSALAKGISAKADNVTSEFTKMSKLMDKIMEQWEAVEMVIGMNEGTESLDEDTLTALTEGKDLTPKQEKEVAAYRKSHPECFDDEGNYKEDVDVNEMKVDQKVTATIKGKKVNVRILSIDSDKSADVHVADLNDPDKDYFVKRSAIKEAVSVDRRSVGFKEALKRQKMAKEKREAAKIKLAKEQAKTDMANIGANHEYDSSVESILAAANGKIMGEEAPNVVSSGAVDMNPTGKNKKDKKESPMAKYGY